MSIPIQSAPTPAGEFQAHFGGPPGSSDIAAVCKKWENLCGDLLVEREQMREDLAKTRRERDQYLKSLYHLLCKDYMPPKFDKEEAFAHLDDHPTIEEIIAELEQGLEKPA
jgi:hypothetical protein